MRMWAYAIIALVVIAVVVVFYVNMKKGSGNTGANGFISLTPEEAKAKMESGEAYTLVDVREPDEYAAGHIAGAVNIPMGKITGQSVEGLPDKGATIMVYCRSGARSRQSATQLVKMGYTAVYDLGGIMNWPYGTVTD
jgi:phage shock protein E